MESLLSNPALQRLEGVRPWCFAEGFFQKLRVPDQ